MTARPRDYGLLLAALVLACAALRAALPDGDWMLAAAFATNGAFCIAHGASHIRRRHIFWGFIFTLMGGFQVGLVTSALIME